MRELPEDGSPYSTGAVRRKAMSTRTRTIVALVTVVALVGIGWGLWRMAYPGSPTASLRGDLRLPQSIPGWLEPLEGGLPTNSIVRIGVERPWLTILWKGSESSRQPSLSVLLGVGDREVEMDMGGQREPVAVDGVQGWLTHLGPEDFVPPPDKSDFYALTKDWRYNRSIYRKAMEYRTSALDLWGAAIALQWNRKGTHYLLMARDEEPMTVDLLLQMANSMAPGEFPFEIGPYGLPGG